MPERKKLDWNALDMDHLGSVKPAWDAYAKARAPIMEQGKALTAKLQPQQDALEQAVQTQLIADGVIAVGQNLKFGYNFGRLAFAVVDAPASTSSNKIRLGDKLPKRK